MAEILLSDSEWRHVRLSNVGSSNDVLSNDVLSKTPKQRFV
jgi:hypothetical protein